MKSIWITALVLILFVNLPAPVVCKQPKRISRESGDGKWTHIKYDAIKKDIEQETEGFLHLQKESSFNLPLEIDVVLVGFGGDGAFKYAMSDEKLEELLIRNYPSRTPHNRNTGKQLLTRFPIVYNVFRVSEEDILKVENTIKSLMVKGSMYRPDSSDKIWGFDGSTTQTYNVEATKLEPVLDEIVNRVFGHKPQSGVFGEWQTNMAIVLLNPSKRRMHPNPPDPNQGAEAKQFDTKDWDKGVFDVHALMAEDGDYLYQYNYNGAGKSQTWLAKGPYLVIDISSGPCRFGPQMSLQGAVTHQTIPRILPILYEGATSLSLHNAGAPQMDAQLLETVSEARDAMFRGKIASVIVSAIRHHILPDVWLENVQDGRRAMVPIMLVRNHMESNMLDPGDKYYLNSTMMYEEMFRLMGSRDKFVMTFSAHSLHEHRALAMSLYKALYSKSEGVLLGPETESSKAGFHTRVQSFVDGPVLLDEFEHAGDSLTSGWISSVKTGDIWLWGDETDKEKVKSIGTRVLPLFILSLDDVPYDLLLDNGGLVTGDKRAVIALQTLTSFSGATLGEVNTMHVAQDEPVRMSTLNIERQIMAGLGTSMMGLTPPQESCYTYVPGQVAEDWLWATGHTPFGPYSNTSTFSALTVSVAHRNMLLAQVERLLFPVMRMIQKLDDFIGEYVCPPFDELGIKEANFGGTKETWIDQLYKSDPNSKKTLIPKQTADTMQQLMGTLEKALDNLAADFYDGDFSKAEAAIKSLKVSCDRLEKYVSDQIDAARENLQCCHIVHKIPPAPSRAWIFAVLIFIGLCAWVVLGSCWIKDENEPGLPIMNRFI